MEKENINLMKKTRTILVIAALVISLIGLAYPIFEIIELKTVTLASIVKILCYLFLMYYLLIGYKKPHSNLMKILFLFFAFTVVLQTVENAKESLNASYLSGVAALFIAYSAGKLNKVKNNQINGVIVLVLLLLSYAIGLAQSTEESFLLKVTNLDLVAEWIALLGTYLVRYEMHIEAGKKADEK